MVDDHEMDKGELRFKNLESWLEGIEGLLQDLVWVLAEKHKYEGDEIFSRTRVLRWIGKEPYIWDGTQTLQALLEFELIICKLNLFFGPFGDKGWYKYNYLFYLFLKVQRDHKSKSKIQKIVN